MRAKEAIPTGEPLFRRLKATHVLGGKVLPEAVDLQGTSCARSAYCQASALIEPPLWPAIAQITPEELPRSLGSDPPPKWDFFAIDDPAEGNEWHCEIRVRREGRSSEDNDRKLGKRPPVLREQLKLALANAFRVVTSV